MFSNFISDIVSSVNPVGLSKAFSVLKIAKPEVSSSNPIDVAAVVVSGLAVVFVALIILIFFVFLYGKIFDVIRESKNKKKAEVKADDMTPAAKPAPAAVEPVSTSDDDEVIAAISAVLAQISSEEGVQYRIKSVTPVQKGSRRNAWAFEGLRQNTNPF